MKRFPWRWVLALSLTGTVLAAAPLLRAAQDKADPAAMQKKTSKGLHFQIPADWPVEERNGVVGPIPVEEYLSRKFGTLESRLRAVEQQVGAMDLKMRVMEEKLKQQQQSGLRSGEATAP